jgi:hypothetical protein
VDDTTLHPNLAKSAAAYDELHERLVRGLIRPEAASKEAAELIARDDEGVCWRIDPAIGGWVRKTLDGHWVADTPPSYGLATATPHDLTPNSRAFHPERYVELSGAADATRPITSYYDGGIRAVPRTRRGGLWILVIVVALGLGVLWWHEDHLGGPVTSPPAVTTTTTG